VNLARDTTVSLDILHPINNRIKQFMINGIKERNKAENESFFTVPYVSISELLKNLT